MKLLAAVAIAVIALIGSPAFSDELTFQQEQCLKLHAGTRILFDMWNKPAKKRAERIDDALKKHDKATLEKLFAAPEMRIENEEATLRRMTQYATIYSAFCK